MNDVTRVLEAIDRGEPRAASELLPLVYDELRKLAAQKLAQEKPGQTLQATALVHEAYIRLVGADPKQPWDSRGHFFAAAAEAMRRILVEQARRKHRYKHGGSKQKVALDKAHTSYRSPHEEVLAIHEAVDKLGAEDAQAAELVKLRYFGGLSVTEAAQAMSIPRSTAYAHWAHARASLRLLLALEPDSFPS